MNNSRIKILISLVITLGLNYSAAQSLRSFNNSGVDAYNNKQFSDAEVSFKKGLEKSKESFELNYNLGDAYYKQQRYEDAIKLFQNSLPLTEDGILKAKAFHNIGNSLLKSEKIKESIEAYKNSLKLNPGDKATKYNLSYALSLLKQQQDQQQNQNQKNQDQNQNDQKNENNNEQQNQQQDQQKNQTKDQSTRQDNMKQEKNKISKEEAERILEALKNNEKDLQKKLRKKVGVPVRTDKDW
jgi:tetratricopeptide (TPR) repeat protein